MESVKKCRKWRVFGLCFRVIFTVQSISSNEQTKVMSVLTDFFMPNQNLKPDFRYLIRFLQGCHFAMFGNLTWQPCKHSLDHISDTIHPISKFLFVKSTIFSWWIQFRQSNVHICHEFCGVARFSISTWQPSKDLSDYISVTIQGLPGGNMEYGNPAKSLTEIEISVEDFAGLPDSICPPGNPLMVTEI